MTPGRKGRGSSGRKRKSDADMMAEGWHCFEP